MTKTIGMLFGAIYLLVGILGFVPQLGGSVSMASNTLLGVAAVNVIHNIVHLIIGIAGLTLSRTEEGAGTFCKTFGVILILVGIVGLFKPDFFGLMPIGGADVWIHLISGAVLAFAGFAVAPSGSAATTH